MSSGDSTTASSRPSIQRLDETVVNRIAAGEVIQRPFNAVKELLENSIDAGATQVQVLAREGGVKLLQIVDNGCGIRCEDMAIVCERFTTSKLVAFSDLRSLATHGFRGEALASVSHVSHVTIVSKTAGSECAHRGEYFEGKLKGPVKYVPGNQGTTITAEDLFFNVPIRRRTLKSPTEEFKKIVEVVGLYSLHYPSVGMSVRKAGGPDVGQAPALKTPADSTVAENIRLLAGSEVADALVEVRHSDSRLEFSLDARVTGPGYAGRRKSQLVLFINHRLVESARLRRAVEAAYAEALPRGAQPFAYVSLQLAPHNVDVNVHPTKHEVFFLHQDAIADAVQSQMVAALAASRQSMTFLVQSVLPCSQQLPQLQPAAAAAAAAPSSQSVIRSRVEPGATSIEAFFGPAAKRPKLAMVGADSAAAASSGPADVQQESVHSAASSSSSSYSAGTGGSIRATTAPVVAEATGIRHSSSEPATAAAEDSSDCTVVSSQAAAVVSGSQQALPSSQRRQVKLQSVVNMQRAVAVKADSELCAQFRKLVFVGCIDRRLALAQSDCDLLLLNMQLLSEKYFYQAMCRDFGNFDMLALSEPVPIRQLLEALLASPAFPLAAATQPVSEAERPGLADRFVAVLQSRALMLLDYFSMEIDSGGNLLTLPLLLRNYTPDLDYLGVYLLRLATRVDWACESACFEAFCRETAKFYAVKAPFPGSADDDDNDDDDDGAAAEAEAEAAASRSRRRYRDPVERSVELALLPAMRTGHFRPDAECRESRAVGKLVSLQDMYRVFERC